MSLEERTVLFNILWSLGLNLWVVLHLRGLAADGVLAGPDGPAIWGRTVLWILLAAVAVTVLAAILFGILRGASGASGILADERDDQILLRGMTVGLIVVGAGFVASMAALAAGWQPVTVFVLLYFAFALGDLASNLVRLLHYRNGV